ncbi:MAG: DUF3810 domain-containing protein [Oscillospiraceae bacterium]
MTISSGSQTTAGNEKKPALKRFLRTKKAVWVPATLILLCGAVLLLAWNCKRFAGLYREYIFPLWLNSFGRLTSLLPFSLGEILLAIFVILIVITVIGLPLLLIFGKKRRKQTAGIAAKCWLWVIAFIMTTETFNCFILYHAPTFAEEYGYTTDRHTDAQLVNLARLLITRGNAAAEQVSRDADGQFVLTADLNETAKAALRGISGDYPQLDGFYPNPKDIHFSYFMSQQYLMGIYFPFTLEANLNTEMYALNMPDTVCHELSHVRGFILEDEANFIAYLACVRSGSADYVYSGYYSSIKYVMNKVRDNCGEETAQELDALIGDKLYIDLTGNSRYWSTVQEDKDALLPSDVVNEVSDAAMNTSLKLNGVEDGRQSYGRMVDLLLNYYEAEIG